MAEQEWKDIAMNWPTVIATLRERAEVARFSAEAPFSHTPNPLASELRAEARTLQTLAFAFELGLKATEKGPTP